MNRKLILNKNSVLKALEKIGSLSTIESIRKQSRSLARTLRGRATRGNLDAAGGRLVVSQSYLLGELDQLQKAQSVERAQYYLTRLSKGLTTVKTSKTNDLNLRRWKQYEEVLTDSLWILPRRDSSGKHSAWYWGNFVPQIPHQLMLRYTKQDEWVLDPFVGSGTTLLECQRLQRNGLGIELNPAVARRTRTLLEDASAPHSVRTEVKTGDSTRMDFRGVLRGMGIQSVQLVILHPPYHDIIRFSRSRRDLSNASTVKQFADRFGSVVDNSLSVLDRNRFLAVIIGDKYNKREWIPLGFRLMEEILKRGCLLKSIVVKNFEQTVGKRKLQQLWRYRALVGGFYVFKHEYIFIFQKQ